MHANKWQYKGLLQSLTLPNPALITTCCPVNTDFSLEAFRHRLDEQGMSIAENQEQSVKSRKKLAETTRGLCFTDTPSRGPYPAVHMPIQHTWNRECWQCRELAQVSLW